MRQHHFYWRSSMSRNFTDTRVSRRPCGPVYINAPADSPIRAALQCHGRLARPPSRPAHTSATGLQCDGQLTRPPPRPTRRPRRLPLLRLTRPTAPAHLSAPAADSAVIGFSFTVMIINSAVDNFWPDISGEINPVNFYILYIVFFKKSNYSGLRGF